MQLKVVEHRARHAFAMIVDHGGPDERDESLGARVRALKQRGSRYPGGAEPLVDVEVDQPHLRFRHARERVGPHPPDLHHGFFRHAHIKRLLTVLQHVQVRGGDGLALLRNSHHMAQSHDDFGRQANDLGRPRRRATWPPAPAEVRAQVGAVRDIQPAALHRLCDGF